MLRTYLIDKTHVLRSIVATEAQLNRDMESRIQPRIVDEPPNPIDMLQPLTKDIYEAVKNRSSVLVMQVTGVNADECGDLKRFYNSVLHQLGWTKTPLPERGPHMFQWFPPPPGEAPPLPAEWAGMPPAEPAVWPNPWAGYPHPTPRKPAVRQAAARNEGAASDRTIATNRGAFRGRSPGRFQFRVCAVAAIERLRAIRFGSAQRLVKLGRSAIATPNVGDAPISGRAPDRRVATACRRSARRGHGATAGAQAAATQCVRAARGHPAAARRKSSVP
jgi:hypothetical protein